MNDLRNKHASKVYKGFLKQCRRQDAKPCEAKIKLPVMVKLPKNFKGKYKHHFTVSNSKWNGMNLKNLKNRANNQTTKRGGMYSKTTKNRDGKVVLSMYGKKILKKLREKRNS